MTTVSLPYQVGAAHAPSRPLPMLSDAIRKRLQPKEASLSERNAMLPAHYESSLVTYAAQSGRSVGTAWKASSRTPATACVPYPS